MSRSSLLRLVAVAILGLLCVAAAAPADDPVMGNPKAAVRVVVYQDLECPSCANLHKELLGSIIPAFGSRVAFEFRDFPLPQHAWSFNAAVLARLFDAKSPKLGLDWRDYCFVHQDDLTNPGLLDVAAQFAAPAGFTRAELAAAFTRADLYAEVKADQTKGALDHVTYTPFVLVNGVPLPQTATPNDLKTALTAALAGH